MNNRSTYIPSKLLLYKITGYSGKSYWTVFGISPDNSSLLPTPFKEGGYNYSYRELADILKKHSRLLMGEIPEELKETIKIVPNSPFRPKISEVSFDPEDNLSRYSAYLKIINPTIEPELILNISPNNKSLALLRLGVYRGEIQRDTVLGYTYERHYNSANEISEFPEELVLIESSGEYYDDIQRRSEWMRNKCQVGVLEEGRVYQMKGNVDMFPETEDDKVLTRQAVYLGKLKFANGTITGGKNPGDKYTRVDCFMSIEHWENPLRKKGAPLAIFTASKDCILCPSIDYPDLFPSEDLKDIRLRFEKSMWSYEFWKTPGVVSSFSPLFNSNLDLLREWGQTMHKNWGFDMEGSVNFFPSSLYFKYPTSKVDIVVNKEVETSIYSGGMLGSTDKPSNRYIAATLDASDPLLPIKIIPHPSEDIDKWLGGKDWRKNEREERTKLRDKLGDEFPDSKRGIKYVTPDGYIFWQCYQILQSFRASLLKSTDSWGSFRQWTICGKIE